MTLKNKWLPDVFISEKTNKQQQPPQKTKQNNAPEDSGEKSPEHPLKTLVKFGTFLTVQMYNITLTAFLDTLYYFQGFGAMMWHQKNNANMLIKRLQME